MRPILTRFHLVLSALMLSCLLSLVASSACAQAPLSLRVPRPLALSLRAPTALALSAPEDRVLHGQQRRAGWLVAVGAGLLVGGITHAAVFGREGICYESDRRLRTPAIAGGVFAAVGLTFLIGGGLKLAGLPPGRREARPISTGKRVGMGATAVGIAAASQIVLFLPIMVDYLGCISS